MNQLVDKLFSVSPISSSLEGVSLVCKSSSWSSKFEWPQEVVGFLEVRTNGINFVNQIFNTGDSMFSQNLLNNGVGSEWDSLFVDFTITSLKDEFSDGFS